MFPPEEQLGPFHLVDTLRVVNIQQGAGGAIYPLGGDHSGAHDRVLTTTGDQQNHLHTSDFRLREIKTTNSRFVPSQANLDARQESLVRENQFIT